MSFTFDVKFSTKIFFAVRFEWAYAFRICLLQLFLSRQPIALLSRKSHTEENMALRNLFDGSVYMEKCLAVAWVKFKDENVS